MLADTECEENDSNYNVESIARRNGLRIAAVEKLYSECNPEGWLYPCISCKRLTGRIALHSHTNVPVYLCAPCFPRYAEYKRPRKPQPPPPSPPSAHTPQAKRPCRDLARCVVN